MSRLIWLGQRAWDAYTRCGVPQAAAALAYFLILTLFPLLMCVNYLIGLFHLNLEQLLVSVNELIPPGVLEVVRDYLDYASHSQSPTVLAVALSAIVLSASAGLRILLQAMDRLYGRPAPPGPWRIMVSVILSVLFLLTVYLSVVVIFTGEWFFRMLEVHLPPQLSALLSLRALSELWQWLRYLLLFCFVLPLVLLTYWVGTPRDRAGGLIVFAALSAAALVACSGLFSLFLSLSSRYSLLYGSLASLIILLVWLYLCGNVLLLGAVANSLAARQEL